MAKKSKREKAAEAVSTVRVPLTEEQRVAKGLELAREYQLLEALRDEKSSLTSRVNGEMKEHQGVIKRLSAELTDGVELKAQRDLTFEEQKAVDEASPKQALHDIAAAACSCASPENVAPACPVHGIGSEGAAQAQAEAEQRRADEQLAAEVAETFAAATVPVDEAVAEAEGAAEQSADDELDAKFPREDVAAAVEANSVDVGTVEEPATVAQFRAKRRARA